MKGGVSCLTLVPLLLGLSTGCIQQRFERRVAEAAKEVGDERRQLAGTKDKRGTRLSWKDACQLLNDRNQQFGQARFQCAELERNRKSFALDQFNPRVLAAANLSAALGDLSSIDSDDHGIRLYGTFNVPNPLSLYARRYSLELQYYQTALGMHELERRLKANLYGQFLRYSSTQEPTSSWKPQTSMGGGLSELWGEETRKARDKLRDEEKLENIRLGLNQLLNTPGENWLPDAATLPDISYEDKLASLNPEKGYGLLAVKQAAGQVEASLATIWRIKMEKLPSFSPGLSVPTLYDSQAVDNSFDTEEMRLFGSMNDSYDFTDQQAESARRAEERVRLVRESLRIRLERESYRLDKAKRYYKILLQERDAMRKMLTWMRKNPPPGTNPKTLIGRVSDEIGVQNRLRQNELQRGQMDLEFWIWDESCWKSPF